MFSLEVAPYSSLTFWVILSLFVLIHRLFKFASYKPLLRNLFMILVSCVVIGSVMDNRYFILSLFILVGLVYFTGKVLFVSSSPNIKKGANIVVVGLIVFVLCYFKYSFFQSSINSLWQAFWGTFKGLEATGKHVFFLGISYFSFKFIHFLIDCHNKKIKDLNLLIFINYTLFFPSFFSGPINRYTHFAQNIYNNDKENALSDYVSGLKRIINGLFKKVVIANNLLPLTIVSLDLSDPSVTPLKAIMGIYAYMFYVYFDFSAYTDMAIGSGRLVGIDLPENFNYPFLKRNLQQFWANWHMSLTTWLTDYIYWPLARKTRHLKRLRKRPVTTSNICIILTFMVCGIWHGDGVNFFLWGTYHGVGLAILNIYTQIEKKYFSRRWKKFINKSKIGYGLSTFVTFQYVTFGFLLFAYDMEELKAFFKLFF